MSDLQGAPVRIAFDGAIGIRNIDAMRDSVLQALSLHTTVQVDCSAMDAADLSVIQVLLAARRGAQRDAKQFLLHAPPSAALQNALLRGGFLPADATQPADGDPFWSGG